MKNLLLLASAVLCLSSCATRKYGCKYTAYVSDSTKSYSHLLISPRYNKDGKLIHDSAVITRCYDSKGKLIDYNYNLLNYKYDISLCRAYGKVYHFDSDLPTYVIKVGGWLLRDDTVITEVKYVIVPKSKFYTALTPYVNTNTDIAFESLISFPNVYDGPDIQYSVSGCVDHIVGDTIIRKDVIFAKGK